MGEDRYTRLRSISEFGYKVEWEDLRDKHIGIVGIGGLGCISAEMMTRCGVKRISLFDFDDVSIVNLNRLMFNRNHIGRSKVEVVAEILREINPDVTLECYNNDIMDIDFESTFEDKIKKMDLILNGLDNVPARKYLNVKCISSKIPYIDAGASRSGLSGYVHPVLPYQSACAECLNRIEIKRNHKKGEPCVASLPSTIAILASIQIQEALKFLLNFGTLIDYLMYDMITGEFHNYNTARDPDCPICGQKGGSKTILDSNTSDNELDRMINDLKEDE